METLSSPPSLSLSRNSHASFEAELMETLIVAIDFLSNFRVSHASFEAELMETALRRSED